MDVEDVNIHEAVDVSAVQLHQLTLRRQELIDRLHARERTLRGELRQLKRSSRSFDNVHDDETSPPQQPPVPVSITGSLPRLTDLQRHPSRPHSDPMTQAISPLNSPIDVQRTATNVCLIPVTKGTKRCWTATTHTTAAGTGGGKHSVPVAMPQPTSLMEAPVVTPAQHTVNDSKQDVMEMLILQNAQMHQLVMQQTMLSSLPQQQQQQQQQASSKPSSVNRPTAAQLRQLLSLAAGSESRQRVPVTVHHHHYNELQPIKPVALPPIQLSATAASTLPPQPVYHAASPIREAFVCREFIPRLRKQLGANKYRRY